VLEWIRRVYALWLMAVFGAPLVLAIGAGREVSTLSATIAVLAGLLATAAAFNRRALKLSLVLSLPLLGLLSAKWIARVGFVIRHSGMDCASCQGSPLLFLWGWIIDSLVLAPGLIFVGLLLWGRYRRGGEA
jgi:hypothetical protein